MFWRVRRYHPHDERFSPENFGFQPTWLILQALEYGAKLRQEELHLGELGIATLSALFVNCNRDPKKGKPAAPQDFFYFAVTPESEVEVPSEAARAFFSLVKDNLLPGWSLGVAPLDKFRKAKKEGTISKPRAWVGEGVLLLVPRLEEDVVRSQVALCDGVGGTIEVVDVDTNAPYVIEIPSSERQWILQSEFNLWSQN